MANEILPPVPGQDANLADYERVRETFDWKQVEAEFDWHRTGRVNMAHEAIDRHARGDRKNKVALIWLGENGEERIFTFGSLHRQVSMEELLSWTRVGIQKDQ